MLLPIALSFVEGCAQSRRYNATKIGVLEWWNNEVMDLKPNTPTLYLTNAPRL